jgi:hypothetical protein
MKTGIQRLVFTITLTTITIALSGCVVSVGSRVGTATPQSPPVIVGDASQAATIAEIDAAGHLNMDNSRTHSLSQISERANLSQPVQIHLVNTAYQRLSFDNNRVHVLLKVIERPDFSDATRHAIVTQLGKIQMQSNRTTILEKINQRMPKVAAQK